MRVLIEVRAAGVGPEFAMEAATRGVASAFDTGPALDVGLRLDPTFQPVLVPAPVAPESGASRFAFSQPLEFDFSAEQATYLVRGEIPDDEASERVFAVSRANPNIVGVFADPVIETSLVCPGDPPVGSERDVARGLSISKLQRAGLDGKGVAVAVVDTGINLQHLQGRGRQTALDVANSWTPANVTDGPGQHPVGHGTMCAYDVGIAAPAAKLFDLSVLRTVAGQHMTGLLSDAVAAYGRLLQWIRARRAGQRALVVTNSWGSYSSTWDFPVGHPSNYSDNARHPFNVIVASLEAAGADILFAAGNCGRECPASRCNFGSTRSIGGANSHPRVVSVGGIDITDQRVGYSSQGPGRLSGDKPDIVTYTHFTGSGVQPADSGTSAACPVAAGVVAAVRTRFSPSALSPAQLRALIFKSARDLGGVGFDHDHGWGALAPGPLLGFLPSGPGPARQTGKKPSSSKAVSSRGGKKVGAEARGRK